MDDVINRLIELDKQARKRVSKAKRASVKSVAGLDEKRAEIVERDEKIFAEKISALRAGQQALIDEKAKAIALENEAALKALDAKFEAHGEEWVSRIVEEITQ